MIDQSPQRQGSEANRPPFSPILLASLALRPLPVKLFTPIAAHILKRIEILYPEIFDRLEVLGHCSFSIVPTDFHCHFVISLDHGKPNIDVRPKAENSFKADAIISGPLLSLINLLEGRVDGDALFFSREITVEGDTEAVLTLRNAIDSADISLDHILASQAGPAAPATRQIFSKASSLLAKVQQDMDMVRNVLLAPLARKVDLQDDELDRQEEKFKQIEKEIRKMKASLNRVASAKERG